ncbi:hypothetical protein GCM10009718_25160 [Isoptericola halotolerans]|uniref:UDP-3-O-[3-hydroxymyristoyl] glucosamine N-acyltransferase n=1 Tax=Isoptericola halotolerans TaxID=300560 RepID=A0ABX2A4Y5_9MICO|nr:transferase [Isoptericola halotolerans]NOV97919.1 UDP-3-O-[3-hydroxymyristoyl] glucosamine N-acyltransferase [Isoptericola halotolerans]
MPRIRMPKRIEFENDAGETVRYVRHGDGGYVSPQADVAPDVVVGRGTYVESGARVEAGARLGEVTWVDHGAFVGRGARVGNRVHLGPRSIVGADAVVADHVHLGCDVRVEPAARVEAEAWVPDGKVVRHRYAQAA